MALASDVDPDLSHLMWPWLMQPMVDLLGPELVYAVGMECLEYPPTWVDTKPEADKVEAAVMEFLEKKRKVI